MTTAPGIHDIPSGAYHAGPTDQPALSASIAKIIVNRSPLHAWNAHRQLNPNWRPDERDGFDLGSAAHILFLEGARFAEKVATIDATDWRTKVAKEHRATSREAGLIPMLQRDFARMTEMVDAIRTQLDGRDDDPPLFAGGKPERSVIWEEDGVICKARLDYLHDDFAAADDLKTVPSKGGTAHPVDWSRRTFWTIGADIEARFHSRGVKAVTGIEPHFRFLVAECRPPYAISVMDLAPSVAEIADRKIDHAIAVWRECLKTGVWPGYQADVASIEVGGWQEADFLERHYDPEEAAA